MYRGVCVCDNPVCVCVNPVCVCVHTDRAVLSVPTLLTETLPVAACAVLHTQRVTHTLVTACARPALLAATHSIHTHPVGAAVRGTHLWGEKEDTHTHRHERLGTLYSVCVCVTYPWSSRGLSSWGHSCKCPCRVRRLHDRGTGQGTGPAHAHTSALPSPAYSGTARSHMSHGQNNPGPHSPLRGGEIEME